MLVDCHVHVNNYAKREVPSEEMLERLLTRMKRYRVDHALVLSSYAVTESRPGTDRVVELCRPHPGLSVVEGIVVEDGRPVGLDGTRRRLEAREVVGLKLYPGYIPFYPNAPEMEPVYELAAEFGVPVMFHSGDTYAPRAKIKYAMPIHIDDVAVDHPDLKVVICHLGNPWFRDTAELVYKNDNVFADISGLVLEGAEWALERWIARELKEVIEYAGEPKYLLYGTDWPLVRMGPYIKFLDILDLGDRALERIRWKNANELFGLGLKPRAAPRAAAAKEGA